MNRYDAVVVGYGPVGAVAANLLAQAGLRVALCDQFAEIFAKPRAIGGDDEMMRAMQACGVAEALGRIVVPFAGSVYLGADGQAIRRYLPPEPPYRFGWPQSIMYIQPEMEKLLRDAIAARPNVDVYPGHRMTGFTAGPHSVSLDLLNTGSDATCTIEASWVLACDGANSVIRQQLGIAVEDLNFDETWAVVDAWLQREDAVPQHNVQYCWPSRPATLVVGPRDLRRWELKLLPGETAADFETPEYLAKVMAPYVDPEAIELWRVAVYRFHATIAASWRAGRIFLVGDAAHQMPPFLGQGLCSGIRDAFNLVWKLLMVHQGQADEGLLDSYQQERLPHTKALVEKAKQAGLVIGEMNLDAARERDAAMVRQLAAGSSETRRQNLIPHLEAGLIGRDAHDAPATGAGTLAPQPRITDESGEEHLLDDVCGYRFALLSQNDEAQNWLRGPLAAFWDTIGGQRILVTEDAVPTTSRADCCVELDGIFAATLARLDCLALIVRPDRTIYGGARSEGELVHLMQSLQSRLFPSISPSL